ncbi:MAG: hypothetical protein WC862_03180 [Patescibacteria group bacterium]
MDDFIRIFNFIDDASKPGRMISSVKIGDVYMTRVIIKPGVITGNYYHTDTRMMFYVGNAPVKAAFEQVKTGERQEMVLEPGKQAVHIPEYVALATQNLGNVDAVLVFFSNRPLRSDDNVEYKVL